MPDGLALSRPGDLTRVIFTCEKEITDRVFELTGRKISGRLKIAEDSSDYMSLSGGTILRLGNNDFFITGQASEGRFGIDEQPKYWVKYVIDLETGVRKIVKLVFNEEFTTRVGPFLIRSLRSPHKEARTLEIVRDHPNFMQGYSVQDAAGNLVRIIDFVPGPNLYRHVTEMSLDHQTYFHQKLPDIMDKLLQAFEALDFLRKNGQQHGDVRTDHLIIKTGQGRFVWIDFDMELSHSDYDLFCLGNILLCVVGKGIHNIQELTSNPQHYPGLTHGLVLRPDDLSLCGQNRIANLAKLYPYIPAKLNRVLMNFSAGTDFFYDSAQALVDDLREALA